MQVAVRIKENSWLAKLAAVKLKSSSMAIVMGNTIHLYNAAQTKFLQNSSWLKHELCHVRQYNQLGFFVFISKYIWFTIKYGYYNNPLEAAARAAENS